MRAFMHACGHTYMHAALTHTRTHTHTHLINGFSKRCHIRLCCAILCCTFLERWRLFQEGSRKLVEAWRKVCGNDWCKNDVHGSERKVGRGFPGGSRNVCVCHVRSHSRFQKLGAAHVPQSRCRYSASPKLRGSVSFSDGLGLSLPPSTSDREET